MAERVERDGLLSEEQRAVLKIDEEKTDGNVSDMGAAGAGGRWE